MSATADVVPTASCRARARSRHGADVRCLRTLGSGDDVELHRLVLLQVAVPVTRDRAEVHEHVGTVLLGDEAEALLRAEPLHGACRHLRPLLPRPPRTCASSAGPPARRPSAEGTLGAGQPCAPSRRSIPVPVEAPSIGRSRTISASILSEGSGWTTAR